jgi:hypothetical protein
MTSPKMKKMVEITRIKTEIKTISITGISKKDLCFCIDTKNSFRNILVFSKKLI